MWVWVQDGGNDALLNMDHVVKVRPTTTFERLQAFDKDGSSYIIHRSFFIILDELNGKNEDDTEEQEPT